MIELWIAGYDILPALVIGALTAYWRYVDGSDNRWPHSNVYAWALVLAACAANFGWRVPELDAHTTVVGVAGVLVGWLLTKGRPGDQWFPHVNDQGKKLQGCAIGYALPTLAVGLSVGIVNSHTLGPIVFAFSGLCVAASYCELTRIESQYGSLPLMTAEKWSRLSMGCLTAGLLLF